MSRISLVDVDTAVIESSLYMYISLLSAVVACCPLAKQIFRPRLISAVFALLFIHSFIHSFTHFLSPVRALSLSLCVRLVPFVQRGWLYWWIFTMITFSCYANSLSLCLLLFSSLFSYSISMAMKKKNGIRTARERRANTRMNDEYYFVRFCDRAL